MWARRGLYPDGLASSDSREGDVGASVGAGDLRQRPYLLQRPRQLIRVFGKREGWSRGVTEIVAVEDDEDVGGPAVAEEFTERLLAATSAGKSRQHQASRDTDHEDQPERRSPPRAQLDP